MKTRIFAILCGVTVSLICLSAVAEEGGTLKGRFVVVGTPAKLQPLKIDKDPFCMGLNPLPQNEAVIIGKNNALVNAVIYLRPPVGGKVELPADNAERLKKVVALDNRGCSFHPHVITAQVGQKLTITNSDPTGHNTNVHLLSYNPIVPAKGQVQIEISKDQAVPSNVECNIHTWMKAYLVSLPHPYVAVSGKDGTFEIKNIPAGQHEFQFWHEAPGYLKNAKFKGGSTDPRQGRAKVTIPAGGTVDLGDIKVSASVLVPKT
jgi:plastocyanin